MQFALDGYLKCVCVFLLLPIDTICSLFSHLAAISTNTLTYYVYYVRVLLPTDPTTDAYTAMSQRSVL